MADVWEGLVNQATMRYLKKVADLTVRKRLLLAMLQKRGLITLNYRGSWGTDFTLDYKEPDVLTFGDASSPVYARHDFLKHGQIDWRGHHSTDLFTLMEMAQMGGGDYVIVDRYARAVPKHVEAVKRKIGLNIYSDGNASGSEGAFGGMDTFTAYTACASTDMVAIPNDTYFSISTATGQSGTWSDDMGAGNFPNATLANDWPFGTGSSDYDFNSPKLINVASTRWNTGSTSWADNCEAVLSQAAIWLSVTAGVDATTLMAMLGASYMSDFKAAMRAKQRILVPHKESEDLGFSDTLSYEGMGIRTEYGCPATAGYVLNVDQAELAILNKKFIESMGPILDMKSAAHLLLVYVFGNFIWKPKFVAKLADFTS